MRGVGRGGDDAEGLGGLARSRIVLNWGCSGLTMVRQWVRCGLEAAECMDGVTLFVREMVDMRSW